MMSYRLLIVLLLSIISAYANPGVDNMAELKSMADAAGIDIDAEPSINKKSASKALPDQSTQLTETMHPSAPIYSVDQHKREAITVDTAKSIPATLIPFQNHETVSIELSSDDPNRLFVPGDQIINVSCPEGFCIIDKHHLVETGDVLLSLSEAAKAAGVFTFFISTANGAEITLLATSQSVPGKTIGFKGKNNQALAFEKSAPYPELLVTLIKNMMSAHQSNHPGSLPTGFTLNETNTTMTPSKQNGFTVTLVALIEGGVFTGHVYAIQNNQRVPLTLKHASFYQKNMAANAFSKETLVPGEIGYLYTLMQASEGSSDE